MLTDKLCEDHVFELCLLEQSPAAYAIIQHSLLYRNTQPMCEGNAPGFAAIQGAFERLLELYPILCGHQVKLPDRNIISAAADSDKPGPLFETHDASEMAVSEFEKVKFHRDRWPTAVDDALRSRTADLNRLIAGTITSFADGFLVTLSVNHIVADGVAVFLLLRQWASLAQKLAVDSDCLPLPDLPIDYDHQAFWAKLAAHPHEAHPFVEYANSKDFGNMDAVQAKLAKLYATGSLDGGDTLAMRVLHVSGAAIKAIGKEYNDPELLNGRPAIHGAQVLYALLWQRYTTAVVGMHTESDTAYTLPVFLTMMYGLRSITPAPDYIGNAVGSVLVPCDTKDVLSMPIIDLAHLIKEHLRKVTPGATVHYLSEVFGGDGSFIMKNIYLCARTESRISISNRSRLAFFDIDFGHGKPIALLNGTLPAEGMASWMPSADGGIDIHYGLKDDMYAVLKHDPILSRFVEFAN
ncbi:hypothetical protein GGH95_000585 [Coemansia sp. RSA 1836]|nr:hypothetical protein GGH95_000585 [Coemansia sp. RSA 1836]